jgi:hypothetical protein
MIVSEAFSAGAAKFRAASDGSGDGGSLKIGKIILLSKEKVFQLYRLIMLPQLLDQQ